MKETIGSLIKCKLCHGIGKLESYYSVILYKFYKGFLIPCYKCIGEGELKVLELDNDGEVIKLETCDGQIIDPI